MSNVLYDFQALRGWRDATIDQDICIEATLLRIRRRLALLRNDDLTMPIEDARGVLARLRRDVDDLKATFDQLPGFEHEEVET